MIGYVEAPGAWSLTNSMARVAGVDLPDAVLQGWLSRGELAELVHRCETCSAIEICSGWLAHDATAARLPGFCRNKAELESLA
ncbi:MAG: hypothetical protein JG765_130 [Cereibacter sp.]|nr:hypothetical protein [Cereibacter sp.]